MRQSWLARWWYGYRHRDRCWRWQQFRQKHTPQSRARRYYDRHYHDWPLVAGTIYYDMRDGQQFGDSPANLLRYWLAHEPTYQHTVVMAPAAFATTAAIISQFSPAEQARITLVEQFSRADMRALLTAQYVVTNALIFSDIFVKRASQVFVNTWHGTPLKKMGYAMPGGVMASWNVIRNFLMTDYLVLPNAFTRDHFVADYRLAPLYQGELVVTGYPRNDILAKPVAATAQREALGIGGRELILYAPTWSGNVTGAVSDVQTVLAGYSTILTMLQQQFPDKAVRLKCHPYLLRAAESSADLRAYLIPAQYDANAILAVTACLITDFSSIFFDFLVTGRPILFLDQQPDYQRERGTYFSMTELPGPVTADCQQLVAWVADCDKIREQYAERYRAAQLLFVAHDDGSATARVVEHVSRPVPPVVVQAPTCLISGADGSAAHFDDQWVDFWQNYGDMSITIHETHLLDNWYGQQFFEHLDNYDQKARFFVDKTPDQRHLSPERAQLAGERVTGGCRFDVVVLPEPNAAHYQQKLYERAEIVVMSPNHQRARHLRQLGYQCEERITGAEIWVRQPEPARLARVKNYLRTRK